MTHPEKARNLFMEGYNCAQSVFAAFCDVTGMDEKAALRLSSSFGAGISGAREVCGAVSAMAMVAGILYGYDEADTEKKREQYRLTTVLLDKFRERYDTIICRDLLSGLKLDKAASERTEEYYKVRPCVRFIIAAAEILDEEFSLAAV